MDGTEGLVNKGRILVDCGITVIFNLGGDGNGFLVVLGLFGGNLYGGILVLLKIRGGRVGLGLEVVDTS
jgi:hypothetical protein